MHGWNQQEGVRTSNEEMDVIVSRGREYYLLKSKWEKEPIEANVIRELIGKLENRIDVKGIVVSMSGYSQGAVDQVKTHINKRVILLFGTESIKSLVKGGKSFEDILNSKYNDLVIKRKVDFS